MDCILLVTVPGVYIGLLGVDSDSDIHIGVGSDVVSSIEFGNARASVRGTDNRRFHV